MGKSKNKKNESVRTADHPAEAENSSVAWTIIKSLKWIFTRAMVFYVLVFFGANYYIDYDRINFGVKVRVLDRYMPSSFIYLYQVEAQGTNEPMSLMPYVRFYSKVVEFWPDVADAHGMLGFCYYHMKNYEDAVKAYKAAIQVKDNYFWFYYNLGVIYFQARQFDEAAKYFEKAKNTNPKESLQFIVDSKVIYRSLLNEIKDPGSIIQTRLSNAYNNCVIFLKGYAEGQEFKGDELKIQLF